MSHWPCEGGIRMTKGDRLPQYARYAIRQRVLPTPSTIATAFPVDTVSNRDQEINHMKRSALVGSMTACFCLALSTPILAAQPAMTSTENHPSSSEVNASAISPQYELAGA